MTKMVFVLCVGGFLSASKVAAQTLIKVEELKQHVGDSVKLTTKIYSGKFLSQSTGTPTLLNAGGVYPNALLTLFISPEVRSKFKSAPEELYRNKNVVVSGRVILFKEKPEIIIYGVGQIEVVK